MILNNAKVVFIVPCSSGGNIVSDNLSDKHKNDLDTSFYCDYNKLINLIPIVEANSKHRISIYPPHLTREYFDYCFNGYRQEFFFFTIVRNPWSHSLSMANHVMRARIPNFLLTLEYKKEINKIISDIYLTKKYIRKQILEYNYYQFHTNRFGDMLDYEYILYFEDIEDDLKILSELSGLEFNKKLHIKHKKIDYREYLTQENIDVIAELRELDCKLYGYDFENNIIFKNNQPKVDNKCKENYFVDFKTKQIKIA